jgi:thiamine pyrophosphate-dependent acetolactate synthase large subunit-like protein
MRRYTIVKHIINFLDDNDILIFSGTELCKEAYKYHKDNIFYIDDSIGVAVPFSLGIAMCTNKRVFVFVGEGELLRDVGVLSQIGASKCRNMFLILLDNGCYQSAGGYPSVFDSLLSKKGFIYNSNTKVITFTKHFKDKDIKRLKNRFERLVGPMVVLIEVDKGIKKDLVALDVDILEQRDRILNLITDLEKETAMFVPPIALGTDTEIKTLNVDTLKTGGTD